MKIVLDLKLDREPKENDVIVFQNGCWKVISKESFLANFKKKHIEDMQTLEKELEDMSSKFSLELADKDKEIKKLQNDLVSLAKIVKEK